MIRLLVLIVIIAIIYILYTWNKQKSQRIDYTKDNINKSPFKDRIPPELTMLGLRIGGIINLKIGAENFLLLNKTITTIEEGTTFIIDRLSISKIDGALGVVRAYCGKYLFQFNLVDNILNDVLLLVVSEKLPSTSQYVEEFKNIEDKFTYKNEEFMSSGYFNFKEGFYKEPAETTVEKLFIRDISAEEETVEYALVKKNSQVIVIYTGLVIDVAEVETV